MNKECFTVPLCLSKVVYFGMSAPANWSNSDCTLTAIIVWGEIILLFLIYRPFSKTNWQKKKLLIRSNFFICQNVFNCFQ